MNVLITQTVLDVEPIMNVYRLSARQQLGVKTRLLLKKIVLMLRAQLPTPPPRLPLLKQIPLQQSLSTTVVTTDNSSIAQPTPDNSIVSTVPPTQSTIGTPTPTSSTAIVPTPKPHHSSSFNVASFIRRVVLVLGHQTVVFFIYNFCKSTDHNSDTLRPLHFWIIQFNFN